MARILIIEDSQPNRDLLKEILKETAECDFAESGIAAAEMYNRSIEQKQAYDVILLDIILPEASGIDLLKKIRKSERDAGILLGEGVPIVMVTGQEQRFLEAYDKGCNDYILKPIQPEVLLQKIRKYLS